MNSGAPVDGVVVGLLRPMEHAEEVHSMSSVKQDRICS